MDSHVPNNNEERRSSPERIHAHEGPFSPVVSRDEVLLKLLYLLLKSRFIRWCCSESSGDGGCRQGIGITEGRRSAGDDGWCV
jgi:hypothetical protein